MLKSSLIIIQTVLFGGLILFFSGEYASALSIPRYEGSRVVGGTGAYDWGVSMNTDSLGNLYYIGEFESASIDLDPTSGIDTFTNNGATDVFLTKINSNGTYAWTRTWGGTGTDNVYSIAFDSLNNVYITLEFSDTIDFDFSPAVDSRTSAGGVDMALIKVNADGTYGGVRTIGGVGSDRLFAVEIDSLDNIYIAGRFRNTVDFDPGLGVDSYTSAGNYDAFFSKINSNGTYAWTRTWGSTGIDTVNDIALDTANNVYLVGGYAGSVDFDPFAPTDSFTSNGSSDVALTRYNADGTYAWTRTWGGVGFDLGQDVQISPAGSVYVGSLFAGTVDFDPTVSVNNFTSNGDSDIAVSKFSSGGTYNFTYTWGGALVDEPYGLAFDADGKWYIVGVFNGPTDLDPTTGINTVSSNGTYDQFLSVFDASDNYLASKRFGPPDEFDWYDEIPYDVHVAGSKLYVIGGYSNTADLNPEVGTNSFTSAGGLDLYYSTYSLANPGVTVSPLSGLITTEAGGTATTTVVLNAIPTDNVVVSFSSSNTGEGTVSPTGSCLYREGVKQAMVSTGGYSTSSSFTLPALTNGSGICERYIIGKHRVELGKQNDSEVVRKIQRYLNTYEQEGLAVDGVYKVDDVLAVKRFQQKYAAQILAPWGTTAPSGIVGLTTIAKMNAVVCGASGGCPYFTSSVKQGDSSPEVMRIKNFLNIVIGSELDITSSLFDTPTENAVRLFQNRYQRFILAPWGLTRGTGWWYQASVRQANKFIGCTNLPPVTLSNGTVLE